jgi:hypothetical protein
VNPDEAAVMEAEADAMSDGLIVPGILPDGRLCETRDGKLPWPGARS